jgi:hypothetical protein
MSSIKILGPKTIIAKAITVYKRGEWQWHYEVEVNGSTYGNLKTLTQVKEWLEKYYGDHNIKLLDGGNKIAD